LKQIANAITTNHPEVHVMVLLIDERPEEVTDFQRSVNAEVVASSNDQDLETHVRLSRFMIERCRRMVEAGRMFLCCWIPSLAWREPTTACMAAVGEP
jgi:transcription termination factor Rho